MFNLTYAVREILGRYRLTVMGVLTGAIAVTVVALTVHLADSLSEANDISLKPLNRLGSDIIVTLPRDSKPFAISDINIAVDQALMSSNGRISDVSNEQTKVLIENAETTDSTIYLSEGLGVSLDTLGFFAPDFEERLDSHTNVREIKSVSLLGHHYEKQTTAKIVTEETSIQPVQLTEAEALELEEKANADPVFKAYSDEQRRFVDIPEEEYTEADWKRMEELTSLMGPLKMRIYNELRPDAFPAALIERKVVKPPAPKVERRDETVGAIAPDEKSGLLTAGDITDGRFFSGPDEEAAILRQDFAAKRGLKAGDTWRVFEKNIPIVGIAWPGLRQNVPDIFVTSGWLKKTYNLELVNLLLVKAKNAKDIPDIKKFIEKEAPGAIVVNDRSIGKKISGSVIETKKLVYGYGVLVNFVVVFVCVLVLVLINFYRLSRRRRDLAVLMALGWSKARLFFQSLLESLILGVCGFLVAGAATVYGVDAINRSMEPLTVSMPRWEQVEGLKSGLGFYTQNSESFNRGAVVDTLRLRLQIDYHTLLSVGVAAIAVIVLAGALSTARIFIVRPSDVLREP